MKDTPHGEAGHLNIFTRDQDSIITHFGKHFRVVAFLPEGDELYCRVDHKHGERMPTPAEILDVARKNQGVRGRWKLDKMEDWGWEEHLCSCTDVHFRRVK